MNAQPTRESFFQTLFPLPEPAPPGAQEREATGTTTAELAGLAYDDRLYVPRKKAQRWIQSRVQTWQSLDQEGGIGPRIQRLQTPGAQLSPGDRVLQLSGERGVGKTWLLRHLADCGGELAAHTVYLDLERRVDHDEPQGFVQAMQAKLSGGPGAGRAILIVDSVPSELDDHLRAMEEEILKPRLAQRGAMVIMALNHPSRACWRTPALRAGASYWLPAFELPQTRVQLRGLDQAHLIRHRRNAPDLHHGSSGLPLLNYLLARWEPEEAYGRLLDHCLASVPAGERSHLRSYLEAVCVLEVLEHTSVDRVLKLHHHYHPHASGFPAHAGTVRGLLRINSLAQAAPGFPGRFVLAGSIRRAARGIMNARDPELYAAMNEAAHDARRQPG
jgi:hypothetical protein